MKTILVATDFSLTSLSACNYAADMAAAIEADLFLFHVDQLPVSYSEAPILLPDEDLSNVQQQLQEMITNLNKRVKHKINIKGECRLSVSFLSELEDVCEEIEPYVVIMGCNGNSVNEHFIFGSFAVKAMKQLTWPLIIVPPDVLFSAIKKIAFACDFRKVHESVPVAEIAFLVHQFKAELYVIHIDNTKETDNKSLYQSTVLKDMLRELQPRYYYLNSGDIDDSIIQFTDKHKIDLLIVLPKRHSLLHYIFQKRHSKQLIIHSHIPVLAIHQ